MAHDTLPALRTMTGISHRRWDELLDNIASLLPAGAASVVIDGPGGESGAVADRLAATLQAAGRPCVRLADTTPPAPGAAGTVLLLADGPVWRTAHGWDVIIWLHTDPPPAAATTMAVTPTPASSSTCMIRRGR